MIVREFQIGVSKFKQNLIRRYDPRKLESVPLTYGRAGDLPENYRKVLELLEGRSYDNNGDVKINDDKLSELLNVAPKTVSRALLRLEKLGYIARITETYRGANSRCSSRNAFYSIRVIRCNRVFLRCGGVAKSKGELGWKTDVRPKVSPRIPDAYISKVEMHDLFNDDGTVTKVPVLVRGVDYVALAGDNVIDGRFDEQREIWAELQQNGNERAMRILGYKKRGDDGTVSSI